MNQIQIKRHSIKLMPVNKRVIIRPFIPADDQNLKATIARVLLLNEDEVEASYRSFIETSISGITT